MNVMAISKNKDRIIGLLSKTLKVYVIQSWGQYVSIVMFSTTTGKHKSHIPYFFVTKNRNTFPQFLQFFKIFHFLFKKSDEKFLPRDLLTFYTTHLKTRKVKKKTINLAVDQTWESMLITLSLSFSITHELPISSHVKMFSITQIEQKLCSYPNYNLINNELEERDFFKGKAT